MTSPLARRLATRDMRSFSRSALRALAGCASLGVGGEPIEVQLVSLTPLPSTAFEHRLRVDLRLRNPNNRAYEIEGLRFVLDVNGQRLASGVSSETRDAAAPRRSRRAGHDHHVAARPRQPDRRVRQAAAAALRVRAARQGLPRGLVGQHRVRAQGLRRGPDPASRGERARRAGSDDAARASLTSVSRRREPASAAAATTRRSGSGDCPSRAR